MGLAAGCGIANDQAGNDRNRNNLTPVGYDNRTNFTPLNVATTNDTTDNDNTDTTGTNNADTNTTGTDTNGTENNGTNTPS